MILTNNNRAIFIETKIKPRKPTDEQLKFIKLLNEKGFIATVIYSYAEFIEFTKEVKL